MNQCSGCGCGPKDPTGSASARVAPGAESGPRLGDEHGAVTRRGVLTGSAAALAALALAACSSSEDTGSEASSAPEQTPTPEPSSGSASESPTGASESPTDGGAPAGEPLATTTEFPTGGGKVVTVGGEVVVLTQPADGQFVAFDGRCPHAGCPVAEVTENTILCTCHGSTFDAATGDRLEGPAPTGLEPVPVVVEGDTVYLA